MRQIRKMALVLAAVSWIATLPVHGQCSNGVVLAEELVLRGLASPDELIVRITPKDRRVETLFESELSPFRDLVLLSTIEPGLLAFKFKESHETLTLAEKAKRLQNTIDALNGYVTTDTVAEPVEPRRDGVQSSSVPRRPFAAEPNLVVQPLATPSDDGFEQQCGLRAINAEKAWDTIKYAPGVKVAIVDSGITDDHPDLSGYVAVGAADKNGHGTHIAGIIGARQDGAGVVGVTWGTDITGYQFLDVSGRGTLIDALKTVKAAIDGKPHIVVLAWGMGANSPALSTMLQDAKYVLFIAAAGNLGQDTCQHPIYPGSYQLENLITVMATTCDDLVPAFSNYGTARIDLAAPGEGLSSTRRIYSTVLHKRWGHLAGTSMSTAFVAGAAALVLEPSLSSKPYEPKQIKCWLNYTAMKLAGLAGKNKSGGRLDLAAAVKPLDESRCRR